MGGCSGDRHYLEQEKRCLLSETLKKEGRVFINESDIVLLLMFLIKPEEREEAEVHANGLWFLDKIGGNVIC